MFKSLDSFQKFQSGSDLWLLFFEPKNDFFKYINWRLDFLLSNMSQKKMNLPPAQLISTYKNFPNKALLCLLFKDNSWVQDIHHYWAKLDKPSLRIFTNIKNSEEQLHAHWPTSDLSHSLSYYEYHLA